ncbi:Meiotic recombination protein SPO11 [Hondaea fermentalgiana]|uniref:DNA topoisomerase (ATP-hydrolyzing) n=1 Tax=Hondaea fermentalgiana TaxID=2315210 RepID=A0A2R5G3G3_9STRA|nr:Meiotic recombination protein SPO11 [Hondaea fermentalgiana]|eukprot:GBG24288.1 Meiotic recombination protein SPO11 [Hondaea fermentalgiana]
MEAAAVRVVTRLEAMELLRALVASVMADGVLELPKQALHEVDPDGIVRVYASPDEATIVTPGRKLVQFMRLVDVVYGGLEQQRAATLRDVYYLLKGSRSGFSSYEACAKAVQQLSWRLGVPRFVLGIVAHSKGIVLGPVVISTLQSHGLGSEAKYMTESAWNASILVRHHVLVPGQTSIAALPHMAEPRLVLVVEKAAVFHQLEQAGLHRRFHCVILTGRGMPCLATRAFLKCLSLQFPAAPILALVDWNPFGLGIALAYAHGSLSEAESYLWAVPRVRLVGLSGLDVERMTTSSLDAAGQPLTAADLARAEGLLDLHASSDVADVPRELGLMRQRGLKLELEAVQMSEGRYKAGLLADDWLPRKLEAALALAPWPRGKHGGTNLEINVTSEGKLTTTEKEGEAG